MYMLIATLLQTKPHSHEHTTCTCSSSPPPPPPPPPSPFPLPPRYNPEHDSESRLLRHRAVALQDMAHSFLDHELSEDFEKVRIRFSLMSSAENGL